MSTDARIESLDVHLDASRNFSRLAPNVDDAEDVVREVFVRVLKEVLILRELEELSYKEMTRIVELPVGTMMSRLARARALLRRSPLLWTIRCHVAGMER